MLKKFSTYQEYFNFKNGDDFSAPSVSLVDEDVIYDSANLFEFVDLGLSVQWATCNVGANSPEEYGLYFAWGETQGYTGITDEKQFSLDDYKFTTDGGSTFTKYNKADGLVTLQADDDAVIMLDSSARMPTKAELKELADNTTSTWITINGVKGVRLTASNGNSIFVPAAGVCLDGLIDGEGEFGVLWTSSLSAGFGSVSSAYYLYFDAETIISNESAVRRSGFPIRAVKP